MAKTQRIGCKNRPRYWLLVSASVCSVKSSRPTVLRLAVNCASCESCVNRACPASTLAAESQLIGMAGGCAAPDELQSTAVALLIDGRAIVGGLYEIDRTAVRIESCRSRRSRCS